MDGVNTFISYLSWEEIFDELPDQDLATLTRVVFKYARTGEVPEGLSLTVRVAFAPIRSSIDLNRTKWDETRKRRSASGRAGGLTTQKQNQANQEIASLAKANQANASFAKANQASASSAKANQANASSAKANQASASFAKANQASASSAQVNQANQAVTKYVTKTVTKTVTVNNNIASRSSTETEQSDSSTNSEEKDFESGTLFESEVKAETEPEKVPNGEREEKPPAGSNFPCEKLREKWNAICVSLAPIRGVNGKRERSLRARWGEHPDLDWWDEYFRKIESSDFLSGRSTEWKATIDWCLNAANMDKVLEGKYENKDKKGGANGAAGDRNDPDWWTRPPEW